MGKFKTVVFELRVRFNFPLLKILVKICLRNLGFICSKCKYL